ncbi:hypothetical protein DKX38_012265 [Salix brachista]|uniref:Uncharacterized protein n=1 Tax=Salix brachista TaxID=2182728 RepID=A0A5N5LN57_9ROSI|nr:hypothetical protein DKX38_012265 [Salix brachista]
MDGNSRKEGLHQNYERNLVIDDSVLQKNSRVFQIKTRLGFLELCQLKRDTFCGALKPLLDHACPVSISHGLISLNPILSRSLYPNFDASRNTFSRQLHRAQRIFDGLRGWRMRSHAYSHVYYPWFNVALRREI